MTSSPSPLLLLPHRRPAIKWSIRTLSQMLSTEQVTCEDLVRYCHATAVAGEDVWKLRAFSRLSSWHDLQQAAQEADERRRQGHTKSILDGIPISIKANVAVAQHALTAGSHILGEGIATSPAVGYNAELVEQLVEDCGAICIGITNMDEFGMGSLGTNTADLNWSPTKNPLAYYWPNNNHPTTASTIAEESLSLLDILQQSPDQILEAHHQTQNSCSDHHEKLFHYAAGGSSCGAAASISHGSSLIAVASDTGGSIRLPAAWCGVAGLKPSYGRNSRHGLVSYASSLDTLGFLTPTVPCASLVLETLNQKEQQQNNPPLDSTSHFYSSGSARSTLLDPSEDPTAGNEDDPERLPLHGIKIGIPAAFVVQECPEVIQELWSQGAAILEQAGATIVTLSEDVITPEIIQQSLAAYYVLACAEASSNLARYDGFRYGVAAASTSTGTFMTDDDDSANQEGMALKQQYAATRTQGLGLEVIRRILCGTAVLSSDKFHTHYEAAAKLRALITQQLHDALTTQVDYLLIPTVVSPPPQLTSSLDIGKDKEETTTSTENIDNTAMMANDIMTVPISLAGLAAVNVPIRKVPMSNESSSTVERVSGLQLVGRPLQEENLLQVAQYLEESSL